MRKEGFTLIELMTVVAVIGILSSMGFVSLQGAIINSRTRDAAVNTAAFLERVGNNANRLSSPLCIKLQSDNRTIKVYKGNDCTNPTEQVDEFSIDPPLAFVTNGDGCPQSTSMISENSLGNNVFTPKIGLSAVPTGMLCARYAETDVYGSAEKTADVNYVKAKWSVGGTPSDL